MTALKALTFCLALCLAAWPCLAQQADSDTTKAPSRFETFEDYFLFTASVNNRSLSFSVSPRVNGLTQYGKIFWYRPGVRNIFNLGAHFKGLGLTLGFQLPGTNLLGQNQVDSRYFDFQIHSFGKRLGYDLYYQDYKGFFVSDIRGFEGLFDKLLGLGELQIRDDLELLNYGLNALYVFNPERYSYRAAFVLDERQVQSGGSFILAASLGRFRAAADSTFVPDDPEFDFHPDAYFSDVDAFTLSVTPGYGLYLVNDKDLYVSAEASALVGLHHHESSGSGVFDDGFGHFLKGIGKLSTGYHGPRWVVGAALSADIQALNTRHVQYRTLNLDLRVFSAFRIQSGIMKGRKSIFGGGKKK